MPPTITRQQSREVDRRAIEQYGMTGLVLMENAGRGTADVLCRLAETESGGRLGRVVVCCGKGNNAGDGFVIARHLDLRGHEVRVLVWADPAELTGDAGANFQYPAAHGRADRSLWQSPRRSPIGGATRRGGLDRRRPVGHRAPAASLARRWTRSSINSTPPRRNDWRSICPAAWTAIRARLPSTRFAPTETCTFVAMKRGFVTPGAEQYTGRVHVLDIGRRGGWWKRWWA